MYICKVFSFNRLIVKTLSHFASTHRSVFRHEPATGPSRYIGISIYAVGVQGREIGIECVAVSLPKLTADTILFCYVLSLLNCYFARWKC
jgi:hypothetical protein